MKVLKPIYYEKFECTADKCKDSCCIGWTVSIDKKTYNEYKKVKGEFGKVLNQGIKRDRVNNNIINYGKMKLNDEKKCVFLNQDNLCNIYINLGSDYLCNTCKLYPRSIKKYGDMIERNLLLSCPEVARELIDIKEKMSFVLEEERLSELDKFNIGEENFDKAVYDLFWKSRGFFIEIAQFREIEIWKRITLIKFCQEKIQKLIKCGEYNKIDELIEELTNTITDDKFIKSLDDIKSVDEVKLLFINSIIKLRTSFGINSVEFLNILSDFEQLLDGNGDNEVEIISEIEKNFSIYFKENEYILENYLVYKLYSNCMLKIKDKDLSEPILRSIVDFSLLKKLLSVKWNKDREKFNKEDIINVIYSFSRAMEHNEIYMKSLCRNIKKAGYDNTAYLTILAR